MSSEKIWAGTVSLQGSIQALSETVELQRHRANIAERKLNAIRAICSEGKHYVLHDGLFESVLEVIAQVIDA